MAPVSRTCRNFLFDRSPRTKSEQSSRSPRITWWKTRPDSSPRWMRERLVLSWKYAEKKRIVGFWGKGNIYVLFYFNYFFVLFEKFLLILDARFFVAGEWTKSLAVPISVDQQQGIFNELSRIDVIIFKNKKLFISILNIYFHVIRTREWRI